jgi:Putative Flp pilus-assembly TadE/G-like
MKRKNQLGQVIVGAAVAMVVLCGFAGLAIDMGTLRYQKRLQQTAADSAAIAGAQNLEFGSGVTIGAQNASAQNGYTDNGGGAISTCTAPGAAVGTICVQVNNPPSTGPHSGTTDAAKYVEAWVSVVQPTYFMQIFGVTSQPVTARAVATNIYGGTNTNCLYTLGPPTSAIIGIGATGKAQIIAPNCGIGDNGNLDTTGNAYTIQANTISVAGQCLGSHCGSPDTVCTAYANGTCPQSSLNNAPGTSDPFTGIVPPSQPPASPSCPDAACNYVSPDNNSATPATIQPGTYSSITIGKNSVVTMAPGIYYINGASAPNAGLNFSGGGTLSGGSLGGDGVMIYFTNGSSINKAVGGGNNADLNLYPLSASQSQLYAGNDTYTGLLFYQDPADTTTAYFGGDNNSTYNGTIYMPTATIDFYGNGTETFNGTVVTYSLTTIGSPIVNLNVSTPGVPVPASLAQPVLVE